MQIIFLYMSVDFCLGAYGALKIYCQTEQSCVEHFELVERVIFNRYCIMYTKIPLFTGKSYFLVHEICSVTELF